MSKVETACPACGGGLSFWCTKTSRADGLGYDISRCSACSSAFVNPRPAADYLEHFYTSEMNSLVQSLLSAGEGHYYEQALREEREFPNSTLDAARIAAHCKTLAPGKDFLDIGAGHGFFSRAALDQGFQVTAIEPAEPSRQAFQKMNGFLPVSSMLNAAFVGQHQASFDAVLMSQVLEHVADLNTVAPQLAALLRPNGIGGHCGAAFSFLAVLAAGQKRYVSDSSRAP